MVGSYSYYTTISKKMRFHQRNLIGFEKTVFESVDARSAAYEHQVIKNRKNIAA